MEKRPLYLLSALTITGLLYASPALAESAFDQQKRAIEEQQRAIRGETAPPHDTGQPVGVEPLDTAETAVSPPPTDTVIEPQQPRHRQHWENIDGLGAFDIIDMPDSSILDDTP